MAPSVIIVISHCGSRFPAGHSSGGPTIHNIPATVMPMVLARMRRAALRTLAGRLRMRMACQKLRPENSHCKASHAPTEPRSGTPYRTTVSTQASDPQRFPAISHGMFFCSALARSARISASRPAGTVVVMGAAVLMRPLDVRDRSRRVANPRSALLE